MVRAHYQRCTESVIGTEHLKLCLAVTTTLFVGAVARRRAGKVAQRRFSLLQGSSLDVIPPAPTQVLYGWPLKWPLIPVWLHRVHVLATVLPPDGLSSGRWPHACLVLTSDLWPASLSELCTVVLPPVFGHPVAQQGPACLLLQLSAAPLISGGMGCLQESLN